MQQKLTAFDSLDAEALTQARTIAARVELLLTHYQDAVNYPSNLLLRYKESFGDTHFSEESILRSRRALLALERKSASPRFSVELHAKKYNKMVSDRLIEEGVLIENTA